MTKRTLFWLWLPLAISFTLMMLEAPGVQAALARLPEPALHLAAFGLTLAISLLIESPVVMLLATSVALVRDTSSYHALRLFMGRLSLGLTALTALIAFTPLFDWITRDLMHTPASIVEAARPAMKIMLFWTAAIGWRRFYQGILVRYGYTQLVSWGTAIRLFSAGSTAVGFVLWRGLPGAQVGAIAVMAGVISEAIATTAFAMPVVRKYILSTPDPEAPPLTQGAILKFHAPLVGTVVLTMLVNPITTAALARLAEPQMTLAAWPVVVGTLLVLRGWGFALQEITIAQAKEPKNLPALRAFAWWVGGVTSGVLVLLAFTPLANVYLASLLGLKPDLQPYAELGIRASVLVPAMTAVAAWARGLLVAASATGAVYWGMGLNLLVNTLLLALGVRLHLPGMVVAAGAYTVASVVEYLYLVRRAAALYAATPERCATG